MPKLSVVIIAKDEARTIGEVILSVKNIAHEIILVDSGSVDATIEIARELGATVVHQDWLGYAAQKNFALGLAKNPWLLSLDADEILPEATAEEIKAVVDGDGYGLDGFTVARLLYIGNTAVFHGGFYPDRQLRLIRNGYGKFKDRLVHESIQLTSTKIGALKNHLLHKSYQDISTYAAALDKYAHLAAQEAARKPISRWKQSSVNLVLHPLWTFIYRYFVRLGFLDGGLGLKLNWLYMNYVRNKILYLRQVGHKLTAAATQDN